MAPSELVLSRTKLKVLAFTQIFCHTAAVPAEWRYRGREIGSPQIAFLRELISEHPELSRYALSKKVCEAWQWKQANGELRDMVCRGLLLMLDRAGAIQLPAARCGSPNRPEGRDRPEPLVPDNRPVRGPLRELGALEFQQVRRTPQEPLFNSLLEQYHYLEISAAGRRAPKIFGLSQRPSDRMPGVVLSAAALSESRSFHRLERGDAQAQSASAGLQHSFSDFALGRKCRTWLRTFWDAWRRSCRAIGNRCMRIRCTGWRPSSTRHASKAPAIARLTGSGWEPPRAVGTTRVQTNAHSR